MMWLAWRFRLLSRLNLASYPLTRQLKAAAIIGSSLLVAACDYGTELHRWTLMGECRSIVRNNADSLDRLSTALSELPYANVLTGEYTLTGGPTLYINRLSFLNKGEIEELYASGKRDFVFNDVNACAGNPSYRNYLGCTYRSPPTIVRIEFPGSQPKYVGSHGDHVARGFIQGQMLSEADRDWLRSHFSERLGAAIEDLVAYAQEPFTVSNSDIGIIPYQEHLSKKAVGVGQHARKVSLMVELLDGTDQCFVFENIFFASQSVCGGKSESLLTYVKRAYLEN